MALGDIQRGDVLGAIALLDDPVEGSRLLQELHFKAAKSYRLIYEGRLYDSKAVVGIAHGFRTGNYLSSGDFTGGLASVVKVLEQLGFYVDAGLLHAITNLRVDRSHGRPAAYQHVVLLWAIARARFGLPRTVLFSDVRDEIAEILGPFALTQAAPDPIMPWVALARSIVWEFEQDDLPAGLSHVMYERVVAGVVSYEGARNGFIGAAVDVIARMMINEPALMPLLERLELAALRSITGIAASPEIEDAIAAVEAVAHPRRKFGRRLTAAENTAIEERAVTVTRERFEQEMGYETEDVGAYESYDVRATKGVDVVKVEVKGTTTGGAAVVLTRNEVRLHRSEHPANALAVVRNIVLEHSDVGPVASGGELVLIKPWLIDEAALSAIAYDYSTGI